MAGVYARAADCDTYVYDQCCQNCRWYGPDVLIGKVMCRNKCSEKKGKNNSESWCWRWQGKKQSKAPEVW